KCDSFAVHTKEMGFQQDIYHLPRGGVFDGVISVTRRNYVCTNCGYYEQYVVEPEALEKIAELAAAGGKGWVKVPTS
ncbi:MAG: hypothetical protein LH614_06540, partial [Pyrinomonadaceae bacterium]|nr:hypothetical protein [Pyrinomonadaceae bacterium]